MSQAPLVSVVTPAYNAANTVDACVGSIRAQTLTDWEMVIVDDGSTDGTWEILERAAASDPRIRPLRTNRQGPGAARNHAIAAARGRFIALLDADDVAVPERLARQVAFLETHADVDVVGGAMERIFPDGSVDVISSAASHEELARWIYKRCPFFTSTVMARRRFFDDVGMFATDLRRSQDYDLWLRGYRSNRYANLPDVLVKYRVPLLRWRDARFSALVIYRNARRNGVLLRHGWCALRPILGFLKYALLRRRPITSEAG